MKAYRSGPEGRRIVITLGDVCGIGPEVILKALAVLSGKTSRCVLVGDPGVVRRALSRFGLSRRLKIREMDVIRHAVRRGEVCLLSRPHHGLAVLPAGRESALAGRMAAEWLDTAVRLVREGEAGALVTGPVNKAAVARSVPGFRGQTEFIAMRAGVREPVMMLVGPTLRVVPITRHLPLRQALRMLSAGLVLRTILTTAGALRRWFGIARPRIAVTGVNPHAGEGGLMGEEDAGIIRPAVRRAAGRGVRASGPHPADTIFAAARQGRYDVVVTAYHDQAMIPIKTVEMDAAVNATLGLPFLRTSPGHGTAFDIANRGVANPYSMRAAIEMAIKATEVN